MKSKIKSTKGQNISPYFGWSPEDMKVINKVIPYEETPIAIEIFSKNHELMTNYGYWFLLSTLWVSYSEHSDLELWKQLFSSDREQREKSIMKPNELEVYKSLPMMVTVYRACRSNETDCISYTLDPLVACRFARHRSVESINQYQVSRKNILALFLRRNEQEVLAIDSEKVKFMNKIQIKLN